MENVKISVIIPAYNAQQHIEETLESVISQSIDTMEVIVVNDGSSDGTLNILRNYEKKCEDLIVIDKENEGVSKARNVALDIAKGEYVFFLDSDDLLEQNALYNLYNKAKEQDADLVIANYQMFDEYHIIEIKDLEEILELDVIDKYNPNILWTFSLWNKLFKRSLIEEHNLRFEPISYSEDGVFTMEFVFRSNLIVPLDEVVLNYRKGVESAITSKLTIKKVNEYITAHHMILDNTKASILRDYPEYKTIEEAYKNLDIKSYFNMIIGKELSILISQFYSKFWRLEDEIIESIVNEVNLKLNILDPKTRSFIMDNNADISIFDMKLSKTEMLDKIEITAVLYGTEEEEDKFVKCLESLEVQNFVRNVIFVPQSMRGIIEQNNLEQVNLIYIDCESETDMQHKAIEMAKSRYIVFCDPNFVYTVNSFKFVFKRAIKNNRDFMSQVVFHLNYGDPQPVYISYLAKKSVLIEQEYNQGLCMDRLLANKFIKLRFLQKQNLDKNVNLIEYVEDFYKKGSYSFFADEIVVFDGTEEQFKKQFVSEEDLPYIEKCYVDSEFDLNSDEILVDPREAYVKLQKIEPKNETDEAIIKAIEKYKDIKVKNQVLFITIRKDGKLEGNAKALYPFVKGKKKIVAARLPHDEKTINKMVKAVMSSKVIVTDDYLKYIRYFILKPEQRVIQLWHACGAFKKFGQRGTNMTIKTDNATHAQYNLVCVSGSQIRDLYADAFNIDLKKVRAIGTPRTDDFFNQKLIEKTRKAIYHKYPEFKDSFNIIYAPTFRDVGEGRQVFEPEIDFDRLSKSLLPNQQFIICPHPVMKNDIIPHKYDNIKVIRDFSTNDLMFISDMLVTDYSSVIFEYALLNKPIAFYCYDLSKYNRGFYLKYPDDLPGEIYTNQDEFEEFIRDGSKHTISVKHQEFVDKYMTGCDGNSCERISKLINSYMGK